MLPPFNGGLHCGISPGGEGGYPSTRAPAFQRRAPLRHPRRPPVPGRRAGCSRLSTAGSIAACHWPGTRPRTWRCSCLSTAGSIAAAGSGQRGRPARACSRLSTAGSIAAVRRRSTTPGRCPSAPAFQRRAPLRPAGCPGRDHRHPGVLPPFNGGLHCGRHHPCEATGKPEGAPAFQRRAPLRLHRRHRVHDAREVLPPFNGGLRCGMRLKPGDMCRAPAFQGGLHCGAPIMAWLRVNWTCAPAFQRRAPLRLAGRVDDRHPGRRVLPPFNGGLHCGQAVLRAARHSGRSCSRLSTAGSIAARTGGSPPRSPTKVLPPFNGGLHCGSLAPRPSPRVIECSRLSTAGSIAASCGEGSASTPGDRRGGRRWPT